MIDRNGIENEKKEKLVLRLFVAGMTPKSIEAIGNIKIICNKYLKKDFKLEIIDIYNNPEIASQHHIIFCPSLIRIFPKPKKILIGTLSDYKKVLKVLGFSVTGND